MLHTFLLSTLIAASSPGDTVRVGDVPLLPPLSVGVDTVDNYVVSDGERRPSVTFVQTVTESDEGLLVVQENRGPTGAILTLDSVLVAHETMATAWHGDVTPEGALHVVFAGARMRGVAVDTLGAESSVDTEVPTRHFDYSLLTLVADRLPLAVGYEATLATYDITRGPVYIPLRIVADEAISLGGETLQAWRMEVDLGGRTVTRWVEKGTARELRWRIAFEGREMIGERRLR